MPEKAIRQKRRELNVVRVYKRVDTCAADRDFDGLHVFHLEEECEANPTDRRRS